LPHESETTPVNLRTWWLRWGLAGVLAALALLVGLALFADNLLSPAQRMILDFAR